MALTQDGLERYQFGLPEKLRVSYKIECNRGRCHPPKRVHEGSEVAKSSVLKVLMKYAVARLTFFFFGENMKDNWIGKWLGPYEVLERTDEKDSSGHIKYRVKCRYCGFEKNTSPRNLKDLQDKCFHQTFNGTPRFPRPPKSLEEKRLHRIFYNMNRRCYDTEDKDYRFYGAKGVEICQEWLFNPQTFVDWALESGYQNNLTIDRIDSSKSYSPENCRWIGAKQNSAYKSSTIPITVDGVTRTGKEWARVLHLAINVINTYRRKNGLEATIEYIKSKLDAIEAQPH